jgi:hypothetical protein
MDRLPFDRRTLAVGRFCAKIIEYVILLAVIAAGVWFGGPRIWAHIQEGEAAKVTAKAQASALAADTQAANRQQASCSAEVAHALDAAKAISRASAIQHPASADAPRPMITDQIKAAMQ